MLNQLIVKNLSKKIGFKTILSKIDLTVREGEIVVITGPNGAGKTTLLRILAGMTTKSAGEIRWNEELFTPKKAELLNQIGILGHRPMVYESLTALENLNFFSQMYNCYNKARVKEMLRWVGLNYYKHEKVANFSRGMQQRLALARMLIHAPQLLLYDEPFTGLDAEGQRLLVGTIRAMQDEGKLQVLITHNLAELAGLNYREVRLSGGKIVSDTWVDGESVCDEARGVRYGSDAVESGESVCDEAAGVRCGNGELPRQRDDNTADKVVTSAVEEVLGRVGQNSATTESLVERFNTLAAETAKTSEVEMLVRDSIRRSEAELVYARESAETEEVAAEKREQAW